MDEVQKARDKILKLTERLQDKEDIICKLQQQLRKAENILFEQASYSLSSYDYLNSECESYINIARAYFIDRFE